MAPPAPRPRTDPELERVKLIARVLDDYFVDPVLGLVFPGAGDLIGGLLGLYIVTYAARRKLSPVILARMLLNLAVDAGLGAIPLVGDLFDLGWKANDRNLALATQSVANEGRASARDWLVLLGAGLTFVATFGLAIYAVVALLRAIF